MMDIFYKIKLLWYGVILAGVVGLCGGYHFGRWNKPPEVYVVPVPIPRLCDSVNI